ncbi:hypothetical protein ACFLYQ_03235 [Chloroflexota bacterium]
MDEISVNDLPGYSSWVARILGIEPFDRIQRNIEKIDAEYEKEKYAEFLAYYEGKKGVTAKDLRILETASFPDRMCISRDSRLFLTSPDECRRLDDRMTADTLAGLVDEVKTVVELGCGYGYNFTVLNETYPERIWFGGEYSNNAVKLAGRLFTDDSNVSVFPFNWYDSDWSIFNKLQEKALVFTKHSIEQLPLVKDVIPNFRKYREKIHAVVHMEPIFELADEETTLGLFRRAYIRLNDYNTDLLSAVKDMGVDIMEVKHDIFGSNPLNPTSIICWRF